MCMLFPAVCDAPASMFAALGVADAFVSVCSLPARCDFLFFLVCAAHCDRSIVTVIGNWKAEEPFVG